jgi:hypothetical protein
MNLREETTTTESPQFTTCRLYDFVCCEHSFNPADIKVKKIQVYWKKALNCLRDVLGSSDTLISVAQLNPIFVWFVCLLIAQQVDDSHPHWFLC